MGVVSGWRRLGEKGFLEEKGGGLADGGIEKAYFASLLRFLAVSIEKETSMQGESFGIRKVKQSVIVLTRKETSMQGS